MRVVVGRWSIVADVLLHGLWSLTHWWWYCCQCQYLCFYCCGDGCRVVQVQDQSQVHLQVQLQFQSQVQLEVQLKVQVQVQVQVSIPGATDLRPENELATILIQGVVVMLQT